MGRHAKTEQLIAEAHDVLAALRPQSLRQIHYQLVSRQVQENTLNAYKALSRLLVDARKSGEIPWHWIIDRLREPRHVPMWDDLEDFAQVAEQYRRDVWATQPCYLEVLVEKDALSAIFEDVLAPYGVTLNVARGYESWSAVHETFTRYRSRRNVTVLYFSDFDPSGEDMVRDFRDRLGELECSPTIKKVALTYDDVTVHQLPHNFTKVSDSRAKAHKERYGDVAVELDALPVDVLRARIREHVEALMDLDALAGVRAQEGRERARLIEVLRNIAEGS